MKQFQNAIITASAGTGKTYRLSIEFISLILKYYRHPDFRLDSILALTFTRKATAEIRERIISMMEDLLQEKDAGLVKSLRRHVPGDPDALGLEEKNILLSAWQEINKDLQNIQVMTIDSYTANIFRNIVRPMKSIDEYQIDPDAVMKSMPLLMNHIMQPQFRSRVDKLLSRKVHRSLDEYAKFFKSMIDNRWLYFLITKRCKLQRDYLELPRRDFSASLHKLAEAVQQGIKHPDKKGFADTLLTEIRKMFSSDPQSPDEFCSPLIRMLDDPTDALNLYSVFQKSIFSKTVIDKAAFPGVDELRMEVVSVLAEAIYHRYYLPEEAEILDVWSIILEAYDKLIYRYKKLGYQDIAWITFEALFSNDPPEFLFNEENSANEFYMFLSHRTRFMLIDEFQDTSLIQFNMLRPIMEEISSGFGTKDFGGLVVVGDEKQSIFGWRGGERDLLLNLGGIIPTLRDLKPEALTLSWRSSNDILQLINAIFTNQTLHNALAADQMNWPYQPVESAIGDLDSIIEVATKAYSSFHGTKADVYEFFVDEMILPELEKLGENPELSIGILCRKTDHLSRLQLLLEERKKTGVFQPSAPLTEHHLVAPLVSWLRFAAYGSWLDFLAFLRSDYLLLGSSTLKDVVDTIWQYEQDKTTGADIFGNCPAVQELYRLGISQRAMSPYRILREITRLCLKDQDLPKRDLANLQAFLSIASSWEYKDASRALRIPDFLDYLEENQNQEGFTQVSVEGSGGIQLLTFHKSKGLQFDKVFVFCDLSSQSRSDQKLFWASEYADSEFKYIKDYSLSFHFSKILQYSPAQKLWDNTVRQAKLEELNNLYVAFTRAKTDLHILFGYNSTGAWEEYLKTKESSPSLPLLLAKACTDTFSEAETMPNGIRRRSTRYPAKDNRDKEAHIDKQRTIRGILPPLIQPSALQTAVPSPIKKLDFKAVYLERRHALYGDLAHLYISFIIRDEELEHQRAKRECIQRFGSILPQSRITRFVDDLQQELRNHSYLFDPEYDHVFTEFAVRKYRIDRLMMNTRAKKALIVDFKTGGIHEQDQLEVYKLALEGLPTLQGYSFETRYVSLNCFGNMVLQ